MRALTIADSADIALGLQDEIRRSEESRYDHRLHGVLLVAQGVTCPKAAQLLGDCIRPVNPCTAHRGVWVAAHWSGSNSSIRFCGCAEIRANTSRR